MTSPAPDQAPERHHRHLEHVSSIRTFCWWLALTSLTLAPPSAPAADRPAKPTFEQYLRESAVPRETIDRFLRGPSWAQFDAELGYVLGNYLPSDGMDRSATISTVQTIVDFLRAGNFDYFDMNEVHVRDFQRYRLSWDDYLAQYLIGHYNPRGNHFFAYSIKDTLVRWLDPKPIPYQQRDPDTMDFKGYLPGAH